MSEVKIPFKSYFREPMVNGIKTCTARTKTMGRAGDRFQAFGATFEIESVEEKCLWEVKLLWREEGCVTPKHFMEVWQEIHPRVGYNGYQRVKLHRFRKIEAAQKENVCGS